jgi:putative hydrolase of the HAD superfamily
VDALGLERFASAILLTGALGSQYKKPGTKVFQLAAQLIPADRYVYIGDNPVKDFTSPKQLGWTTVRVRRLGGLHCNAADSEVRPDHDCTDCTGVIGMLLDLMG